MGTTPLRRFLQSLCDNSCWNYAVFWKLQQQSQMILKWEDGYFGSLKVKDSTENIFSETSLGSVEETSSCKTYTGTLGGDAVELAVTYMSSFQYALGDGIVGDVAYRGNYRWFLEKSLGDFNTTLIPEHADELLFQLAAGVKTILFVPVIPHGVLQLGSLEDLPEDAEMASYIKDEFFTHQHFRGYSDAFTMNEQFLCQSPSPLMSNTKSLDELPSFLDETTNINNVKWSNHKPLTKSLAPPPCDTWYSSQLPVTNMLISSNGDIHERNLSELEVKESSNIGPLLSFPKECELHKALGPAFMGKTNGVIFYDEDCSVQTGNESSLSDSFGQFAFMEKRETQNKKSEFWGESSLFKNHVESASLSRVKNLDNGSSASATSYEGVVDRLAKEEGQNSTKPLVGGKRRGKPGGKQKARPRDRQLIQDRLKELRELVPDGAKCSIDGLLDRTVSHMLFLKSVGDRASKLRQCVKPEGVGTRLKNNTTPEEKGNQNGASWAFELGGDLNICPILVEDLQCPGHMIIEMICDESSRFLEITEVIRGLNLTILKGVMEKRSENMWARFVIEAPKGFHRLDVFWPLMKLLQQHSPTPISSKI